VKPVLPDRQSEVSLSRSQRRRPGRAGTKSASQCYLYEIALVSGHYVTVSLSSIR